MQGGQLPPLLRRLCFEHLLHTKRGQTQEICMQMQKIITNIRTSCVRARLRVYPDTRLATFRNHFGLTLFYENPDRHHQSDIIHHQDSSLTHFYVHDSSRASHKNYDICMKELFVSFFLRHTTCMCAIMPQ